MSILFVAAAVGVVVWAWDVFRRPVAPCWRCKGRRRKEGSRAKAWRPPCGVCGGSGERKRVGAKALYKALGREL